MATAEVMVEEALGGTAVATWDNTAMSGTAKRVTGWVDLGVGQDGIRDVSFLVPHTGTAVGAYTIEEAESLVGTPVASVVPSADFATTAINNNAGKYTTRAKINARYARLAYTNTSGTGTLSPAHVCAKASSKVGI